jgi:hypothetical protein
MILGYWQSFVKQMNVVIGLIELTKIKMKYPDLIFFWSYSRNRQLITKKKVECWIVVKIKKTCKKSVIKNFIGTIRYNFFYKNIFYKEMWCWISTVAIVIIGIIGKKILVGGVCRL